MGIELKDKHVVVTGGTGGLGTSVVEKLCDLGATCHIPAHEPPHASFPFAAHKNVRITSGVDLTSESAVVGYYGALPPLWASIHLAGGFGMSALLETSLSSFDSMMRVNASTCFLCCREGARAMRKAGQGGRIINVSSRGAADHTPGMISYVASKAAVSAITVAIAAELKDDRILVNAIVPSIIDTPANRKSMPNADFDRWPKATELADVIAALCSPQNAIASGALIPVYGRA